MKDPRKNWRAVPAGVVGSVRKTQDGEGDNPPEKARQAGVAGPSAEDTSAQTGDWNDPVTWLKAVAALEDASQVMAALGDDRFVASLFRHQRQVEAVERAFRGFEGKAAVWRGLAWMYPLSAPLLNRLNPLFDPGMGGEVAHFLEALDLALARQRSQLESLSDLFSEERRQVLAEVMGQVEALQIRLGEVEAEWSRLISAHGDQVCDREALQEQLAKRDAELREIERLLEEERAQSDDLSNRLRTLDRQIEQATRRRQQLAGEVESMRGRHATEIARLGKYEEDLTELEQVLTVYRDMPNAADLLQAVEDIKAQVRAVRAPDRLDGMGQEKESDAPA